MALPIRQNATHKVVLGPVVAVGDGFTPVTTLALSTADEAEAILHDNGTVVDISGYTWAAITTADGYYHLTLQSGISGTVGHLTIVVNDDSLCLPVKADFIVMEEAAYDALYASGADAHTASISDIESSLVIVKSDIVIITSDTTAIHSDTTIIASDIVHVYSDTTAIHSDTTIIASDVVVLDAAVSDVESSLVIVKSDLVLVYSDTTAIEAAGGLTAAQDSKLTKVTSDVVIIGSDILQVYSDTTAIPGLIATAQADLDILTGTDGVTLATSQPNYAPNTTTPLDAAGVRTALGMASADLDTQLDAIKSDTAAILIDTNELQGDWANGGRLDLIIDAILADTGTDGVVLTAAERNAIADAILNRDMSTGADSGSPTVRTVRQALRFSRNKVGIAGGTLTVYKEDDATASWTASISTTAGDPISEVDPA